MTRTTSSWMCALALIVAVLSGLTGCGDKEFTSPLSASLDGSAAANQGPTSSAGPAQVIALAAGQLTVDAVLDGSGSSDPDGTLATYTWTGSPDPADVARPTVTLSAGVYVFTLVVTDNDGVQSAPATVTIAVILPGQNLPPTASAGNDMIYRLAAGQTEMDVPLDATGSTDLDGTVTGYTWTGTPDPADVAQPTVTLVAGTYIFTLVVTDDRGVQSDPATVTIIVAAVGENLRPQADPGEDITYTLPAGAAEMQVTLDGSGSSDPDGTVVAYTWTGTPDPADVSQPTVTLAAGNHVFTLVVTDNGGAQSDAATVTIAVRSAAAARPPVIELDTLSYAVTEGGSLSFTVAATDPDGDRVSLSAAPALSNAAFSTSVEAGGVSRAAGDGLAGPRTQGAFALSPQADQQGVHLVTFTARDPGGLTDARTVRITVSDLNRVPILSVAAIATVDEGKRLTLPVQASDADGDILTFTTSGLPDNALFLPATGTLVFAPAYDQAGTYTVGITADDGMAQATGTVEITVNDVPTGGGAAVRKLELDLNPVDSPSLLRGLRLTGVINPTGDEPEPVRLVGALIEGMSPATGRQGETLEVTLTGQSGGTYDTHFVADTTQADFGPGVVVNSVRVDSPSMAVVSATIGSGAALGPRSVTLRTGTETAVAVLAFHVTRGRTTVSGTLVDPDSGAPIAGAMVGIQGTALSTTTAADGSFTLADVPAGAQTLYANAPDRELILTDIDAPVGTTVELGDVETWATVYDPAASPTASLHSVLGRGIAGLTGAITVENARQVIRDAILYVGGTEAGVLDAYGNQLNPNVTGDGKISVKDNGVDLYATRLAKGESVSLLEVCMDLAFAFQWNPAPPTLAEMIAALQTQVDAAWDDPNAPDSALPITLFNRGETLTPNPPELNADTRLNAFQAYLMVTSFMTAQADRLYAAAPRAARVLGDLGDPPGIFTRTWDEVLADFGTAVGGPNVSSAGEIATTLPDFEELLKKYYLDQSDTAREDAKQLLLDTFPTLASELETIFATEHPKAVETAYDEIVRLSADDLVVHNALRTITTHTDDPTNPNAAETNLWSMFDGQRGNEYQFWFGFDTDPDLQIRILQKSLAPSAPYIYNASDASIALETSPGEELALPAAKVSFYASSSDKGDANPDDVTYIYRLWRIGKGTKTYTDSAGEEQTYDADLTLVGQGELGDSDRLAPKEEDDATAKALGRYMFKIPFPPPGTNHYRVDCIRYTGDGTLIDSLTEEEIEDHLTPWLSGVIDDPGTIAGVEGLEKRRLFPGQGTLEGLTYEVSHLSNAASVYMRGTGSGLATFGRVDLAADRKDPSKVYLSIPDFHTAAHGDRGTGSIFRYDALTEDLSEFVRPSFMTPGQVGLAIDGNFNLYTENGASEVSYGGKVFRILGQRSANDPAYEPENPLPGTRDATSHQLISTKGQTPATRQFVGTVNYYSQLLNRAQPTAIQAMVMGNRRSVQDPTTLVLTDLGEELYLADAQLQQIRSLSVQAPELHYTWDPWRVNAKEWARTDEATWPPAKAEAGKIAFTAATDLAFDTTKTTLYFTKGSYVVRTTAGTNQSESITQNGTIFQGATGIDVCSSRGTDYLFVADSAQRLIFRIPMDEIPIDVPADATEKDRLVSRYTFLTQLNRPGQLRITDNNRAMVLVDEDGLRYVRFGFTGIALDENDLPLIGAVVTVSTSAGLRSATTDANGVFNFEGPFGYPVLTATVSHPSGTYSERVSDPGGCHSNLQPAPCVLLTEPADGAWTADAAVTVRGAVYPREFDFSLTGGRLVVTDGAGLATAVDLQFTGTDNEFEMSGVPLSGGDNTLIVYTNAAGVYAAAGSLPSRVVRTSLPLAEQAVSGVALDAAGNPLAGAAVEISINGVLEATTEADACGYYNLQRLSLGVVSVEVTP